MKNLLLIISILGILIITSCKKEDNYYTDISISSNIGLEIVTTDEIDVVVYKDFVRVFHINQTWIFFTNKSDSIIKIGHNGTIFNLLPDDQLSLPLIIY